MSVYRLHDRPRTRREPYSQASRDDLGETVEPDHASDFVSFGIGVGALEGEVGGGTRGGAVVEVVVRVVFELILGLKGRWFKQFQEGEELRC